MEGADLRVHRLGMGRLVGTTIAVVALLGLLDLVRRGQLGGDDLPLGLLCLALIGLCYLLGLRPAVLELSEALVVRNPLRTAMIPWPAITEVTITDVVVVSAGEQEVRCFALPRRGRGGRPSGVLNPGAPGLVDQPPAAPRGTWVVAERLRSQAEQLGVGHAGGATTIRFDPVALAVGGVVAVLAAGSVLAAVIR